jgi:4-hydroxy-3-polyprenylbenzoate decarboxylase
MVAAGLSSDLLKRAADVQLKERKPLVIVPRETPLSLNPPLQLHHPEQKAGAHIVAAIPAW